MIVVGEPFSLPPAHPFVLRYDDYDEMRRQRRHTGNKRKKGLTAPATRRGVEMPASIMPETMTDRHRYPPGNAYSRATPRAGDALLHLESIYQGPKEYGTIMHRLQSIEYSS